MADNPAIILFLKAPDPGRVKTRLAASLGEVAALDFYRCFVKDTLGMLVRGGYPLLIFFDPPDARQRIGQWLGELRPLFPQEGKDLGERMKKAFQKAFSRGAGSALLMGSDSPDLPKGLIDEATDALKDRDAVLGPACDGGYYLIGFRRETFLAETFTGIPWSTPEVLTRTLEALGRANRTVHLLPPWRDVDTLADLQSLVLRNGDGPFSDSATMKYLRSTWKTGLGSTVPPAGIALGHELPNGKKGKGTVERF